MKQFELKPKYQKSFYGKAIVEEHSNGDKYLVSYRTVVCMIDGSSAFHRYWDGYSATTAKHIDEFRRVYGMSGMSKKEWLYIPVEKLDNGELLKELIMDYRNRFGEYPCFNKLS